MRRLLLLAAIVLLLGLSAGAGDLAPPGSPAPTMHNLQEIYDQLAQANAGVAGPPNILVFPSIVEQQGTITNTTNTFDTSFYFVATGLYKGQNLKDGGSFTGASGIANIGVNLYVYDNLGQPAKSLTGNDVAFPASITLGNGTPRAAITLEALFQAAGGFAITPFTGYAVLTVNTGDWGDVAVQAFTLNAHANAFDLAISPLEPIVVRDVASPAKRAAADMGKGNENAVK